jgi:FKBP-type peptidyl-prolyl cis-trans isomerase FklB
MLKNAAAVFGFIVLASTCHAAESSAFGGREDMISYSIGYQIGTDFKRENRAVDPDAFLNGMKDALAQKDLGVAPEEMRKTLLDVKKRIAARQRAEKLEMREQRLDEGKTFFAENGGKEGVVTLPSGLQYKVITQGTGEKPGPTDRVLVHYTGTLLDGTVFGSTGNRKEPKTFYVNGVVPGLTEGLQLMREGAKWEFYIPADLAYGSRGALADRSVIFELELLKVESPE